MPYDQLGKLQDRLQGQGRAAHLHARGLGAVQRRLRSRPSGTAWTGERHGPDYLGRWRTVMVFGRGIAGKYYTALDITSPGQFNRSSLDTCRLSPIWSRGNPDTQRGALGGARERDRRRRLRQDGRDLVGAGDGGGEPRGLRRQRVRDVHGVGIRDRSTNADEGKIFYAIDSITGDVRHAAGRGGDGLDRHLRVHRARRDLPVRNALVANAAAYIPIQLQAGFVGNPAASTASLVYIGDLHGRMWKFITNSTGLGLINRAAVRRADERQGRVDRGDLGHDGNARHQAGVNVVFNSVFVPDAAVAARRKPGVWHPLLHLVSMIAFPIVYSVYTGVAEAARDMFAVAEAAKRRDPAIETIGELETELAATRMACDALVALSETASPGPETTNTVFIHRSLIARGAIRTVELAMEVAGGAAYFRKTGASSVCSATFRARATIR